MKSRKGTWAISKRRALCLGPSDVCKLYKTSNFVLVHQHEHIAPRRCNCGHKDCFEVKYTHTRTSTHKKDGATLDVRVVAVNTGAH